MIWDTIIVGGGTAGCVLASRLSEESSHRVLLVEAGEDTPDDKTDPDILDSYPGRAYLNPRYIWNDLKVRTAVVPHNDRDAAQPALKKYEQGRVLGGGSSINGQLANRGAPSDFAEWERRGASGWGWENVLPYFRKLESDQDFDGPLHGKTGPIPIRRTPRSSWPDHARAMGEAFEAAGWPYREDQNGPFEDGYFSLTMSNIGEQRVSAARGYLTPDVRSRSNLTIMTETQVSGLEFEGLRCVGIRAVKGERTESFRANEVILSSGAIHSPAHLLRAGIGPVGHLRDIGIDVRVARAGVGQRLMDHPAIAVASYVNPHARMQPEVTRRHMIVGLRYSSGLDDIPKGDMCVVGFTRSSWHQVGERIGFMLLFVNRTCSETGQVSLTSSDWRAVPSVEFNLLSDHRDLVRMREGFRMMTTLYEKPSMRRVATTTFAASTSDRIRRVGAVNLMNRIQTSLFAPILDLPEPIRGFLFRSLICEAPPLQQLKADDAALDAYLRNSVIGVWHASCSCRMGASDDPMAVTDSHGRVYGVDGLRVVDASIFPIVPCANTNIPTMMVAEKIADAIKIERRSRA